MKNIFKIFQCDAKRLATNVVALVIVMGLSIIPALYAWFNILSNWDPYGESATSQMKVAVYSADRGFSFGSLSLNVGDSVTDGLKANTTIDWVFCESKEETLAGVYSGDYYAALIIPAEFTSNMLSFIGGDPVNPTIEYYENSKKNAIATKITGKVKQTVQQTVNTSFVSTLTETVTSVGEGLADNDTISLGGMISTLKDLDNRMDQYILAIDSLALMSDSMAGVLGAGKDTIPDIQEMLDGTNDSLSALQETVLAGSQSLNTMLDLLNYSFNQAAESIKSIETTLNTMDSYADLASNAAIQELQTALEAIRAAMESINWDDDTLLNALDPSGNLQTIKNSKEFIEAKQSLETISADLEQLILDSEAAEINLNQLRKDISAQLKLCTKAIKTLQSTMNGTIAPDINNGVLRVENALISTQKILSGLDDELSGIEYAMGNYQEVLNQATLNLQDTKEMVRDVQGTLSKIAGALEVISGDADYEHILELLTKDPASIAKYVTSPVEMNTVTLYEIKGYGSAMAPFYTVLALWVGALIMVALVHVKVVKLPDVKDVKTYQEFFGRYITFFIIGQAQTVIAVLGVLFFVQIHCMHPLLFLLACMVTSLVFTMIMYSLTVAFGNIGQALAVIIMVIQVAGAGCTFPIEVLPEVFQTIYKLMPFHYAMNTLKGCVGGFYGNEYWINLGILLGFGVLFALIGLFFKKPFAKLNAAIEKSKEKSGLLL